MDKDNLLRKIGDEWKSLTESKKEVSLLVKIRNG